MTNYIPFRYRAVDGAKGVTGNTAKRLAAHLAVDEIQAIHQALHDLAMKVLLQYEPDNGPLSATQSKQIKKQAPQSTKRLLRWSLCEFETA